MIQVTQEALDFITAEVLTVHTLCDRALVPRDSEGETLSMAQRVNILKTCYRQLIRRVGKVDPTILH